MGSFEDSITTEALQLFPSRMVKRGGEYRWSCEKIKGLGSTVKRVPDFAFTTPDEFKAGLIQAYFDGNGNFQADETIFF